MTSLHMGNGWVACLAKKRNIQDFPGLWAIKGHLKVLGVDAPRRATRKLQAAGDVEMWGVSTDVMRERVGFPRSCLPTVYIP